MALMTSSSGPAGEEELSPPGVSVDMHLSYLAAARVGEEVLVEARTVKRGRTLAFLECEVRKKETGAVVVRGSHTKFIGG